MKYNIPVENFASFEKKMMRIINKAERYNVKVKYEKGEEFQMETSIKGCYINCIPVEVSGEIKFENWEVCAILEHYYSGNIVKIVGEHTIPDSYRTAKSNCDHCGTRRQRNKTVVLYNNLTKEYKQVGTSCLAEYTFGISADSIAEIESLEKEPFESKISGCSAFVVHTINYLCYVYEDIKDNGYISKKRANEINNGICEYNSTHNAHRDFVCPTCIRALEKMGKDTDKEYHRVISMNKQFVEESLSYIRSADKSQEFMWNLSVIAENQFIKISDTGFASCIPNVYLKHIEYLKKQEAQKKNNEKYVYYGNVGDKVAITGNIACCASYGSQFGEVFIYKLFAQNHIFVWKTTKVLDVGADEKLCTISGTLKAHEEFRGVKQNVLTRCKVNFV